MQRFKDIPGGGGGGLCHAEGSDLGGPVLTHMENLAPKCKIGYFGANGENSCQKCAEIGTIKNRASEKSGNRHVGQHHGDMGVTGVVGGQDLAKQKLFVASKKFSISETIFLSKS